MKNPSAENQSGHKIPWGVIVQVVLALVFFFLLSRLISSLSFAGQNGIDTQATASVSALEIFDNFGFQVFDTKWNESTWAEVGTGSNMQQLDGVLLVTREAAGSGGLVAHRRKWHLSQINYVKSRLRLSSAIQTQAGALGFGINTSVAGTPWFAKCELQGGQGEKTALVLCHIADKFSTTPVEVAYDAWHTISFEIDAENAAITFFADDQNIGQFVPPETSGLESAEYTFMLEGSSSTAGALTGAFDYVQVKNR
jgi:hypothetical protein